MSESAPKRRQRLDVASLLLGLAFGVGTNLITASPDRWWRPLRVVDQYAPVWMLVLLLGVAGYSAAGWYARKRRVAWRGEESPFPGLMAFTADRSEVFFGRETEADELARRLTRSSLAPPRRFIPVVGPSGIGKTSLIAAGVLPRLSSQWAVVGPFLPGLDPFHALADALLPAESHDRERLERWASDLRGEAVALCRDRAARPGTFISLLASAQSGRRRMVLVIDQLEELNTHGSGEERRAFLVLLCGALEQLPYLHVIVALPADALSSFSAEHGELFARPLRVGPMDSQRLRQTIVKPAAAAGIAFEDGVVEQMLAEATVGDALPLLAHLLERLHLAHGSDGYITADEFNQAGRVIGAITEHADEVLADLSATVPIDQVDEALLSFVGWNGHEAHRRHVPMADLGSDARRIVEEFRAARLIADTEDGSAYVLAHDALLRQWEHIRDLVASNEERLRRISLLQSRASDWVLAGHRVDDLLRGDALTDARELTASRPVPSTLRDYLRASASESDDDARRHADRIAEQAQELRDQDRPTAMALAKAAVTEVFATPISTLTLWGLTASPVESRFPIGHTDRILAIAWRADGSEVVSVSADRSMCAWRRDGEISEFHSLPKQEFPGIRHVILSPDASHLIALTDADRVVVWDNREACRVAYSRWQGLTFNGFAWSQDGKRFAAAPDFNGIDIWDFTDTLSVPRRSARTETLDVPCHGTLAWSPDDTRIATISGGNLHIASVKEPAQKDLRIRLKRPCDFISWTPDSQAVVIGEQLRREKTRVKVFDARSGDLKISWTTDHATTVACAPDGGLIAVLHRAGLTSLLSDNDDEKATKCRLSLWDLTGHLIREQPFDERMDLLCWSPDSTAIALAREWAAGVVIVNLAEGHTAETGGGPLRTVRWSPDRSRAFVTWTHYKHAGVVRPQPCDVATTPQSLPLRGSARLADWSPDGALVALHGDGVEVLDGDFDREAIAHLDDAPGFLRCLAWSPDGSHLATSTHHFWLHEPSRVTVWEALTGREIAVMRRDAAHACPVDWSPDGTALAGVHEDGTIVIWHAMTGEVVRTFSPAQPGIETLGWSPDGRLIACSGDDGVVHFWAAATGTPLMSLRGHTGKVRQAVWSPDGEKLATYGDDTIRLWCTESGSSLAVLDGSTVGLGSLIDLAWSLDSQSIIVTASNNVIREWALPQGPEQALCLAAGREVPKLSAADRERYGLPPTE